MYKKRLQLLLVHRARCFIDPYDEFTSIIFIELEQTKGNIEVQLKRLNFSNAFVYIISWERRVIYGGYDGISL